jgi:hypothetical protein
MELVSELQTLQFLKLAGEGAVAPSDSWGTPLKALSQMGPKQGEMAMPRTYVCPDAARRLRILAMAAGAVA